MLDDLNRLIRKPPADKRLATASTPTPIRSKAGLERVIVAGVGGSIASPLTEASVAARTYHENVYVTTSDGLFAWPAVKSITLTDGGGSEVIINFANPAA